MRLPIFQVDAFAPRLFAGNPAAVCPLERWLPDATMQSIAAENNLSETAFFVPRPGGSDDFDLRWFTPAVEVELCGHATLASGHVVLHHLSPGRERVRFWTRSGPLEVERAGELLALDLPADPPRTVASDERLARALGIAPVETLAARYALAVLASEEDVRTLRPDFAALERTPWKAVIVTAKGREADFVSRFFAPGYGILEDPVTGSAHCALVPYWSKRLGKPRLRALQVSTRGGELDCELRGERVRVAGRALTYLEGTIAV